ncbi:hypothetical protein C1701_02425 [Actinoalloteichus sp. AHMU CJ021]|nr:hypothetical protein C1701_02425 [Actinoalloteichus sp. AHMU CJ021]
MPLRCNFLGPMEITLDGHECTPSPSKLRTVIALLALRPNQLVQARQLVDELWGQNPPATAPATLQTYIYKLRKMFVAVSPTATGLFFTRRGGYGLEIEPRDVDSFRFLDLVRVGLGAMDSGDAVRASDLLNQALRLWRGAALDDLDTGPVLAAQVTRLEESRLRALETRIEADLRLGRHRYLIGELKQLVITHPLHESFHGHLMIALHQCGRQHEALSTYQRLRRLMIDELGLEPSADLRRLQQDILAGDGPAQLLPGFVRSARTVLGSPAQLPPAVPDFVGRETQLRDCEAWVRAQVEDGTSRPVVVVRGLPGIGRRAFTTQLAHRVRELFPDGQFHLDMAGAGPGRAHDALARFLRAAGFAEPEVPSGTEERADVFRTWTASRRVLVSLTAPASAEDVLPLLPTGPHCAGLIAAPGGLGEVSGARAVDLEPLTTRECLELLTSVVGRRRVLAEREQAEHLAGLCGGLPLAIRCIGARLAAVSPWPIRNVLRQLEASPASLLDLLAFNGLDVRARFEAGCRGLPRRAFDALCLLATLDEPEFAAHQVAPWLGCSTVAADQVLMQLAQWRLLEPRMRETGRAESELRFTFHPLLRLFASERMRASVDGPDAVRRTGTDG